MSNLPTHTPPGQRLTPRPEPGPTPAARNWLTKTLAFIGEAVTDEADRNKGYKVVSYVLNLVSIMGLVVSTTIGYVGPWQLWFVLFFVFLMLTTLNAARNYHERKIEGLAGLGRNHETELAALLTEIESLKSQLINRNGLRSIRGRLTGLKTRGDELHGEIAAQWSRDVAIKIIAWADEVEGVLRDWQGDDSAVERFRGSIPEQTRLNLDDFPEDNPEAIASYTLKRRLGMNVTEEQIEEFNAIVPVKLRSDPAWDLRTTLRAFMRQRLAALNTFVAELKD